MDENPRVGRENSLVADFEAVAKRRLAFLVLSADAKVISSSPSADSIFADADGLAVVNGRLRAAAASDDAKLLKAVAGMASAAQRSGRAEGPVAIRRRSGKRPYLVSLETLSAKSRGNGERVEVMAIISDTERKTVLNPKLLERIYDLAPREANLVALLVQGLELREAAGRLGIQETSARTYLKEIFSKTATHRQAELVSVVLSSVAALLPI